MSVYRELSTQEYNKLSCAILYEDNHLLIVNKRVGDIVQGDKSGDENLVEKYKAFIAKRDNKPGKVFMGLPHRLDRPVSGITILTKTSKSLERMSKLFREGKVEKYYIALCCKAPKEETALIENYLSRNEKLNKSFIVKQEQEGAKKASLLYRHIGNTQRYALVKVQLLTGRHHQIRCQLSNIGCIIKGDLKYGAARSNPDGGICLHAYEIRFEHPIKKTKLSLSAPLPTNWKGTESLDLDIPLELKNDLNLLKGE